jgi:hypothetical protein
LRLHDPQLVLEAQQRAKHIGVEHRRVAVRRLLGDRPRLALGAGIIDGDVEPAEAGDGVIDQAAHILFVAHVGLDEGGLRAERMELGFQRLAFGLAAAGGDDGCAVLGEGQRGGAADAGQCAGDQDDGRGHFLPFHFLPAEHGWESRRIAVAFICAALVRLKKTL